MEERRKFEEDKKLQNEVQEKRKKDEIEFNIRMRKENRQRSVQEMIKRTREIVSGASLSRPLGSNAEVFGTP